MSNWLHYSGLIFGGALIVVGIFVAAMDLLNNKMLQAWPYGFIVIGFFVGALSKIFFHNFSIKGAKYEPGWI
mgnify:CR=1 FL=1